MTSTAAGSALFEQKAHALARAWMVAVELQQMPHRAAEIERDCDGNAHLIALSRSFEAVVRSSIRRLHPSTPPAVADALAHARQVGWPRAVLLAEAAQGQLDAYDPARLAESRLRLLAQGGPDDDARPAIERVWTDVALCAVTGAMGDYTAALRHGVQADEQAQACGADLPQALVGQGLAFVFLSVGDLEGASRVLDRSLAAARRSGAPHVSVIYNLLLCHVLAGRTDAAVQLLGEHPDFVRRPRPAGRHMAMDCLVARVLLDSGRAADALRLVDGAGDGPDVRMPAMSANRAWLEAEVRLANGQPGPARTLLDAALQGADAEAAGLSPLNRTQLERVLSQCCEALGDWPGALAALKRSQLSSFTWVADSMRSRLRALHLETGSPEPARHERRLHEVELAVQRARDEQERDATARNQRYLAHVTHEMRNPLNGVIGMTSLLAMSQLDERQRKFLGLAQSSAQMLLALCNDLLDLAKIESGRFELNPEPQDLRRLFSETVAIYEPQVSARNVGLSLVMDPRLPLQLVVDRLRIQQILMNLIGNAVKFTRKGSIQVVVNWQPDTADSGRLSVDIIDTGPGLTATQRSRLFQEFSQADATVASEHGGTGLGLALCRSLVQLMDGTIDVDSTPGQGSRFWFRLPACSRTEDAQTLRAATTCPANPGA